LAGETIDRYVQDNKIQNLCRWNAARCRAY
jgi:hypothetical protein